MKHFKTFANELINELEKSVIHLSYQKGTRDKQFIFNTETKEVIIKGEIFDKVEISCYTKIIEDHECNYFFKPSKSQNKIMMIIWQSEKLLNKEQAKAAGVPDLIIESMEAFKKSVNENFNIEKK